MRLRVVLTLAASGSLLLPIGARADYGHVVMPGETLTSIAAADGMSVDQLAAANGLSTTTELLTGSVVEIPPLGSAPATAPVSAAAPVSDDAGQGSYVVQPGDTLWSVAERSDVSVDALAADNGLSPASELISGTALEIPAAGTSAPTATVAPVSTPAATTVSDGSSQGSYVVQAGDTLWTIAQRAGLSVDELAAQNDIDPNALLLAGSVLEVPGAESSTQPVGAAAEGSPEDPPYPTPEYVNSSEVGDVAEANGVPASLADAVGWQESGFNNDLTSSSDARGVMQITPGTWSWIDQSENPGPPLAPASAIDNVRGGVLLLRWLLNSTDDNPELAAAGYIQGLPSVERYGMFPETQQYVDDVMALSQRFAGL
ncbi:MAG TPA: LysM peptidoglycan-binding domain-containing protein [Solirubrobacteraceae bacterium]|nr:LysM peptidoglycan-binding domain-containing protein [Solirubrobacteraceae bacterium]